MSTVLLARSQALRATRRPISAAAFGLASPYLRSLTTTRPPQKPISPAVQDIPHNDVYNDGMERHQKQPGEAQHVNMSSEVHRPLEALSTPSLLRALLVHTVSDNDMLFKLSNKLVMGNLAALERPTSLMKWVLDQTFYKQFCGGSNALEIQKTVSGLRDLGIRGVILTYAKEVSFEDSASSSKLKEDIKEWLEGSLKAVDYASEKDFVALKFSGAGKAAVDLLAAGKSLSDDKSLEQACLSICEHAQKKGIRLMIDAEHQSLQSGVDAWTIDLMRRFNRSQDPFIYNTYQMYRRAAPAILAGHLNLASEEGFSIGVKLVRGAYLASEPRDSLCATKEQTDQQYDFAIYKLLTEAVKNCNLGLCVASHNRTSSELAKKLMDQSPDIRPNQVVFAQLHGMADELSLDLANAGVEVYKYVTFGTTAECAKYLMRRAEENREGASRSEESKMELNAEVWRRLFPFMGDPAKG